MKNSSILRGALFLVCTIATQIDWVSTISAQFALNKRDLLHWQNDKEKTAEALAIKVGSGRYPQDLGDAAS